MNVYHIIEDSHNYTAVGAQDLKEKEGNHVEEQEFVVVHGETVHSNNGQRWAFPMLFGGGLIMCGAVVMQRCKKGQYDQVPGESVKLIESRTLYV